MQLHCLEVKMICLRVMSMVVSTQLTISERGIGGLLMKLREGSSAGVERLMAQRAV